MIFSVLTMVWWTTTLRHYISHLFRNDLTSNRLSSVYLRYQLIYGRGVQIHFSWFTILPTQRTKKEKKTYNRWVDKSCLFGFFFLFFHVTVHSVHKQINDFWWSSGIFTISVYHFFFSCMRVVSVRSVQCSLQLWQYVPYLHEQQQQQQKKRFWSF